MEFDGIELKEFKSDKPVLFDPPRKMLAWNRNESEATATFVFAFCPSHMLPVNGGFFLPQGKFVPTTNYHCCAEIPECVDDPKVAKDYGIAHGENAEYIKWLAAVFKNRPRGNFYVESERGYEIGTLCFQLEREMFSWRRSDPDTFWIDVQLFVKYKLSDDDIRFIVKFQAGVEQNKLHADEKNAYAEMRRGFLKLKNLLAEKTKGGENAG